MWKYGMNLWQEGDAGRTQEGDSSTDTIYLEECEVLIKYMCVHNLCIDYHIILHKSCKIHHYLLRDLSISLKKKVF